MTNFERVSAGLGIAAVIFGLGVGWQSINTRFERLTEKVTAIEQDKAEGLCLTIMKTQLAAIEKGKTAVGDQCRNFQANIAQTPAVSPMLMPQRR